MFASAIKAHVSARELREQPDSNLIDMRRIECANVAMRNLTAKQRKIAIAMVNHYRAHHKEFTWIAVFAQKLYIQSEGFEVEADIDDIKSLAHAGLIDARSDSGCVTMKVRPEGIAAVKGNFGMKKRRVVLEALYENAGGDTSRGMTDEELADWTGLSTDGARTEVWNLAQNQLTHMNSEASFITVKGIDLAETPDPDTQPKPAQGGTVVHQNTFLGPVGAYQPGSGNKANVTQQIGILAEQLLPLIEAIKASIHELPQEKQADAAEYTQLIEEEAKSPKPSPKKLKAFATMLLSLAASVVPFADKASQLLKACESIEKTTIDMIHQVRP